jgi:hypothetical protein
VQSEILTQEELVARAEQAEALAQATQRLLRWGTAGKYPNNYLAAMEAAQDALAVYYPGRLSSQELAAREASEEAIAVREANYAE